MPKRATKDQVLDENGKRRFHGAFTGGFSAGYFNTVGSEEGFLPTGFISTREKRVDFRAKSKEEYMDEEDDLLGTKQMQSASKLGSWSKDKPKEMEKDLRQSGGELSSVNVMGVARKQRHYYGIGYTPLMRMSGESDVNAQDSDVLRMSDIVHGPRTNASKFGIGALDDNEGDEDVYNRSDHRDLERELASAPMKLLKDKSSIKSTRFSEEVSVGTIAGFVKQIAKSPKSVVYPPPNVPSNYKEMHYFERPLDWSWLIKHDTSTSAISKPGESKKKQSQVEQEKYRKEAAMEFDKTFSLKFTAVGSLEDGKMQEKEKMDEDNHDGTFKVTNSRAVSEWRPSKLLCKRFNIIDPFKGSESDSQRSVQSLFSTTPNSIQGMDGSVGGTANAQVPPVDTIVDLSSLQNIISDPLDNIKQAELNLFEELFGGIDT